MPASKAACLTSDLIGSATDCATFEAGSTATAKVFWASPNNTTPNPNTYWQIGGTTSASSPITLTNLKFSNSQSGPFNTLLSGSLALGANGVMSYSAIQGPTGSATSPNPLGTPFWVQYDIPAGLAAGETVSVRLASNNDNAQNVSGDLTTASGNNFYTDIRINTAALAPNPSSSAVPGPLPLLGAAAAFSASRRLRRRIGSAA